MPDGYSHRRKKVRPLHVRCLNCFSNICREDAGGSDSRGFLFAVGNQVVAQTFDHLFFPAFVDFALQFFQAEVHHIVMMQLFRSNLIAESQP